MSNLSLPGEGVPAGPATPAPTGYASFWKIWLPIAAVFVLLDVTFNLYFWRIPKLSKANADYGYQFMIDAMPLWQETPNSGARVLAFGSSVALSFDPRQVRSLLDAARPAQGLDVHRLLLPGAHPSDYLLYFDARPMPRTPDAVIVLVNLVDFLYPSTEREVNPTLRFILPPWKLLADRRDRMSITSQLDTALSGVSRLYRYRKPIRSSLQDHLRAATRWVRQWRSAVVPYGVDPDGYARQSFGLPLGAGSSTALKYFIDPEWIRQRGEVRLELSAAGQVVATRVERNPGWKTIRIDALPPSAMLLEGRTDSLWTARAAQPSGDPRLRGLLLAEPPTMAAAPAAPFRYRLWQEGESDEFLRMGGKTGEEFAAAWQTTLQGDTRFGQRFRLYRDAKLALCAQPFDAGGEYQAVRQLVELFRDRGAQVIVINSPESPWILESYRDTPYYRGYLEFFRGLAATSSQVRFYDWSNSLPAEDFNDWHHPSYIGSIKLGLRYAEVLGQALPAAGGERSH